MSISSVTYTVALLICYLSTLSIHQINYTFILHFSFFLDTIRDYISFISGKRMCPGDELSRMLSCGLVVRLFRRKRIRLASNPPTEEEMMGTVGVTLSAPHVKFFCDSL